MDPCRWGGPGERDHHVQPESKGHVVRPTGVSSSEAVGSPTVEVEEVRTVSTGVAVSHRVEVRFAPVDNDPDLRFYVEALCNGEVVAVGYGSDEVDALLDLIPALIPATHPEYEPGTRHPEDGPGLT